jgi:hypothetical protein
VTLSGNEQAAAGDVSAGERDRIVALEVFMDSCLSEQLSVGPDGWASTAGTVGAKAQISALAYHEKDR